MVPEKGIAYIHDGRLQKKREKSALVDITLNYDIISPNLLIRLFTMDNVPKKDNSQDQRPWGSYHVLSAEPDHKVKRIVVYARKRLSFQRHFRRSEHWHIITGNALVTLNDKKIRLGAGMSIDIPLGAAHRIENRGVDDLVFIEIQRGDYFGEDDIERLEDDFGRASSKTPIRRKTDR